MWRAGSPASTPLPKLPTPAEVAKIATEVLAKGDAVRGEKIFRRGDVGCVKCHAVSKAGGNIGPDLGPIGATSPMDYIVSSILDPNAAIKEEYLTKVISTASGQVVTGIVVMRDKSQVVLKDATGKRVSIAAADIDEEGNGKSLMPEGITRMLTQAELLDLIRFVSELGKPGPFLARAPTVVHRWKRLRDVTPVLADGVPNLEVIRDSVLRAGPEAWDTAYHPEWTATCRAGRAAAARPAASALFAGGNQRRARSRAGRAATLRLPASRHSGSTTRRSISRHAVVPLSVGQHRIARCVRRQGRRRRSTVRLELRKARGLQGAFRGGRGRSRNWFNFTKPAGECYSEPAGYPAGSEYLTCGLAGYFYFCRSP